MEWNPLKWPLSCISGILVIVIFFIFIPTSVVLFSGRDYLGEPYNIIIHYLSDLGNVNYNPNGAIFFNFGLILIGIMLIPFFMGLSNFQEEISKKNLLKVIQILGILTAFSLMMVGVFSENAPDPLHGLWSTIFFGFIFTDIILASIMIRNEPNFIQAISYYGFIICGIDLLFGITGSPFVEWMTVLVALSFVGLIVYNGFKIEYSS